MTALAQARTILLGAGLAAGTAAALLAGCQLRAAPGPAARLERAALHGARAAFLLLGLALAIAAVDGWLAEGALWPRTPHATLGWAAWLIWFTVLHVHRVKGFKGRTAAIAGLAGWALSLLAALGLR